MAMSVQYDFAWPGLQLQLELRGEVFKQHRRLRDDASFALLLAAQQIGRVFFDRGQTARFTENKRSASLSAVV